MQSFAVVVVPVFPLSPPRIFTRLTLFYFPQAQGMHLTQHPSDRHSIPAKKSASRHKKSLRKRENSATIPAPQHAQLAQW